MTRSACISTRSAWCPCSTAEEERELSRTIEAGVDARRRARRGRAQPEVDRAITAGAAAKDRFIRSNLRLVVSVARRYPLPPGMELLDLVQEGNLGLEHAVDKFDWRKGFKFSTYATFWIRQAIGRALDQKASLVRLPGDRSAGAAGRAAPGLRRRRRARRRERALHRLITPTSLDRTSATTTRTSSSTCIADGLPGPEAQLLDAEDDRLAAGACSTCSTPGPAPRSSSASA